MSSNVQPGAAAAARPAPTGPARWQIVAAFAAVYIIWGSTYLAILFAIETLPPFLMGGMRFLVAGALLYGWTWAQGTPAPTRAEWRAAAILGVLFLVCGNGGVAWAEQRIPSGMTALLIATTPLWVVVLDWARPGGRRPSALVLAGVALGLVGLVLLIGPDGLRGSGAVDPVGAGVLLASSFLWSVGMLYSRRAALPSSPLLTTAMEMLAGGVGLTLLGLAVGDGARLDLGAVSLRSWLAVGYLIVFGSLIAFTANVWLLKVVAPARVATYAYVNPVVAVFLGWALAGEELTTRTLVAAAVIVAAVAAITLARSRGSGS